MADEGLRFEAYSMPHVGALTRKFDFSKWVESYTLNDRFNDLCDGVLTLPDDFSLRDDLFFIDEDDHTNDVGSMIRVSRGTTPILHYLVTRSEDSWSDQEPTHKLSLEGLEWLLDRALVPNYDDPADPTVDPDWIYGADSILTNSTFESSPTSNEIQYVWVSGMSGANTFTLTYSGQTTSSLAWDADWFDVGTALEALSNIQDVTVSGAGTAAVPWIVEFLDPAGDVAEMTITPSAGTGTVSTIIPGGQRYPEPWTTSYNPETGEPHGTYQNFQITSSQAHTGTYSLLVNAAAPANPLDYPGAQQIVNVTPGRTYRAEVWVRASFSSTFRLVIHTFDETLIAQSAGDSTPITANTWTKLTVSPFVIPAHVTRVIFRVGLIDSTDQGEWFIDDAVLAPGFPAATLGYMMNDIRTAAVAGGVLTWLTPTWSTTLDSDGNAWDQDRSWNVNHGQTFLQLFEYCRKWNYEFRLRWDAGDARFEWDMWNPSGGGQARANIALTGKSGVMGSAPIVKRPPNATYVKVEGERGTWGEFASTTLDDVWGRLEKFHQDRQGVASAELDELATRIVTRQTENTASRAVTLSDPSLLPWSAYEPGDTLTVNLAPKDDKRTLRVAAIVVSKGPQDAAPRYDVHFGAPVYSDPVAAAQGLAVGGSSAIAQGLRTLIREFRRPVFNPPAGESEPQPVIESPFGGGGGAPSITIGAFNTSDESRLKVDFGYQCSGSGDNVIIQNAVTALAATGGEIILTEGHYYFDNDVNLASTLEEGTTLTFRGLGTSILVLNYNGTLLTTPAPMFTIGASGGTNAGRHLWRFLNLEFDGAEKTYSIAIHYANDATADSGVLVEGCTFRRWRAYAIWWQAASSSGHGFIHNNIFLDNTITDEISGTTGAGALLGIDTDGQIVITNNIVIRGDGDVLERVQFNDTEEILIANNFFDGDMVFAPDADLSRYGNVRAYHNWNAGTYEAGDHDGLTSGTSFTASGSVAFTGDITPAQITGTQNNYNPTGLSTASTLRLSSDAARSITGLAGGSDGRIIIIENIGGFNITLENEDAGSDAANRFALATDLVIGADDAAILQYDSTDSRWRLPSGNPGSSSTVAHDHTATAGDGGVLTNDEHDGYSEFAEIASPSTPAANKVRVYAKDDGGVSKLFYKGDGGTEVGPLGASGSGTDADAIHDNVSGEISAITEKTAPIAADLLLIEDSAASNAKRKVQIGNLPFGLPAPGTFDDFFDNASLSGDWTAVLPSGSHTITEADDPLGVGRLSVVYSGQSASDLAGIAKTLTGITTGDYVQAGIRMLGYDANYSMAALVLSDGTATTSNIVAVFLQIQGGSQNVLVTRGGTFDSVGADIQIAAANAWNMSSTAPELHVRLTYQAANTFRVEFSPDGISWIQRLSDTSRTITPTHGGLGWTVWGGSNPAINTFTYFKTNV